MPDSPGANRRRADAVTMADVTELDATAVVHQLLAAAGSQLYDSRLIEFERLSDIGCDLLFAVRDRPGDVPIGARSAHPRDIVEDVWRAFVVAARRWPDRFLERVLSEPDLHGDIEILDALGEVDRPASRELLVAAIKQRRAGHALGRKYALGSLIRLADPQVPDLLVGLVKDRDSSVRFAAVRLPLSTATPDRCPPCSTSPKRRRHPWGPRSLPWPRSRRSPYGKA